MDSTNSGFGRTGRINTDDFQDKVLLGYLLNNGYRAPFESALEYYKSETGYSDKQFYNRLRNLRDKVAKIVLGAQRTLILKSNFGGRERLPLIRSMIRFDSRLVQLAIQKYPEIATAADKVELLYYLYRKVSADRFLMASYLVPTDANDLKECLDALRDYDKNEFTKMFEFVLRESKSNLQVYHSFQELLRKENWAPLQPLSRYIDFSIINTKEAGDDFFRDVFGAAEKAESNPVL